MKTKDIQVGGVYAMTNRVSKYERNRYQVRVDAIGVIEDYEPRYEGSHERYDERRSRERKSIRVTVLDQRKDYNGVGPSDVTVGPNRPGAAVYVEPKQLTDTWDELVLRETLAARYRQEREEQAAADLQRRSDLHDEQVALGMVGEEGEPIITLVEDNYYGGLRPANQPLSVDDAEKLVTLVRDLKAKLGEAVA